MNKYNLFIVRLVLVLYFFSSSASIAAGVPYTERTAKLTDLIKQVKGSYSKKSAEKYSVSNTEAVLLNSDKVLNYSCDTNDTKELQIISSDTMEVKMTSQLQEGVNLIAGSTASVQFTVVDAIKTALALNPNIRMQQEQVESSRGLLQQAMSKFDLQTDLAAEKSQTYTPQIEIARPYYQDGKLRSQQTAYSLNYQKKMRTGDMYNLAVSSTRSVDDTPAAIGIPAKTNSGSVNFTIVKPLFKGRGEKVNTVEEKYASLSIDADHCDLLQTVSKVIYDTTTAYWNYAAAVRRLAILKTSEDKAGLLLEETRKLIDASEIPAAELQSVMANLASKKASIIQAEQSVYQARSALGIQLGVNAEEIEGIFPPSSDFPPVDEEKIKAVLQNSAKFKELAIENRNDNKAAELRKQAAGLYLIIARDGLKPQVDLQTALGYSGLSEGREFEKYFSSLGKNITGMNMNMQVKYSWPEKNRQAAGYLQQQEATYRKTEIQFNEVRRNIVSSILTAMSDLDKSFASYRLVNESLALYEKAVENEKTKYRFGASTLLDIITVEDRYTEARLSQISSRASFAMALSKLKYETAATYDIKDGLFFVDEKIVTALPENK